MILPSKELISEVLSKEVEEERFIDSNSLTYVNSDIYEDINIYEFAFKCKEWAYENNYYVYSTPSFALEGVAYIVEDNNIGKRLKTLQLGSEVEAIIQACEWILKEVNK